VRMERTVALESDRDNFSVKWGFLIMTSVTGMMPNALDKTEIYIFDRTGLARMQKDDPVLHGRFLTLVTKSICLKFRRLLK